MTAKESPQNARKSKRLFVHRSPWPPAPPVASGSVSHLEALVARNVANTRSCPTDLLHYEPMFAWKENKSSRAAARAADALDLMIEFATLGEYGLEYPEPVRSGSRKTTTPEFRLASAGSDRPSERTGAQKHRQRRRPCRPGRTRVDLPGWGERQGQEIPGVQPDRRHRTGATHRHHPTSALPDALRPPRIRLANG